MKNVVLRSSLRIVYVPYCVSITYVLIQISTIPRYLYGRYRVSSRYINHRAPVYTSLHSAYVATVI